MSKQSSSVLQEGYSYDALGNVLNRTQYWGAAGFDETFTYDALNRLETSAITGQPKQFFTYDDIGNITSKTGVGTYHYPPPGASSVRPHAVSSIDAGSFAYDGNGNLLTAPGRGTAWTWTSFNMPLRATKGGSYSDFVYGADHERLRQTRSDGTEIYYAGAMETEVQDGVASIKTYWPMGLGVEIERDGTTSLNWTHLDRLGSVVAITDETGAAKEQLAYDAWGNRRYLTAASTPGIDHRGFTGHEMLDQIDLVHMNGRIYDPLLARFLSADPLIQEPTDSQSYNRYSYVWNNPTNLTDPSGFQAATVTVTGSSGQVHFERWLFEQQLREIFEPLRARASAIGRVMSRARPAVALNKVDNLLAQIRRNLVGAIPFIGQELADSGDDPLRIIDPYQTVADAARAAGDGNYVEAGVGVLSVAVRPAKAAGPMMTEGVVVTEKGLALVEQNLARFERYAPNEAMVQSLRDAMSKGVRVAGAEANFYLHEIAENTQRLRGLDYEAAHAATLNKYNVNEFMLYSEKVIRQFPSEFNNAFRKFWGIK